LSLPFQAQHLYQGFKDGFVPIYSLIIVGVIFVAATWFIVYFTTAQRRIPIQNMRRQVGNRTIGGGTNYLPLSVNMAGVLPIIFAFSLVGMPAQFGTMLGTTSPVGGFLTELGHYLVPSESSPIPGLPFYVPKGFVGSILFTALIFFFTYFWTAIQYNVGDIADNLKKNGSFIPGIRPGKQTKDYLDGVISRITVVGALFIAAVALIQYITPSLAGISPAYISVIGGTSLLIMVSVALETMRQIEANLLMKQYGQ
jgi:preprotein translocase subunit SecY